MCNNLDNHKAIQLYNKGWYYETHGEKKEAVIYYKQAADLGHSNARSRLNYLKNTSVFEMPTRIEGINTNNQKAIQLYNKGWYYETHGEKKEAAIYYKQAADMGNTNARSRLKYLKNTGEL